MRTQRLVPIDSATSDSPSYSVHCEGLSSAQTPENLRFGAVLLHCAGESAVAKIPTAGGCHASVAKTSLASFSLPANFCGSPSAKAPPKISPLTVWTPLALATVPALSILGRSVQVYRFAVPFGAPGLAFGSSPPRGSPSQSAQDVLATLALRHPPAGEAPASCRVSAGSLRSPCLTKPARRCYVGNPEC